MKRWHIIALALLVVLMLSPSAVVIVKKKLGKRVTNAPAGADGVVRRAPGDLAREAGVALPVYALARMLRSEHGSEAEHVKVAVGWAAVNQARARKTTIEKLLLSGRTKSGGASSSDGLFGAQYTGKYATTAVDPTAVDVEIAGKVLSGVVADPTFGATQFDSPKAQAAAGKRGVPGYTKTAAQIAAARAKGSDLVVVNGIDPNHLRFWRPRKGVA
jgi:hypothetical protein